MALLYGVKYYSIKGVCISNGKIANSKWLFLSGQAGLTINYFNVKVTMSELPKDSSDPLPCIQLWFHLLRSIRVHFP